jgi:hypothetical protein
MVSSKKLESCGAHHNSLSKKEPFNQNCSMQEPFFSWKGQIGNPLMCTHIQSFCKCGHS